ncbi:hypothetical protein J4731_15505 [Providencia rettgeri]|nr:hypothetical protein [Providencia rettgeri]
MASASQLIAYHTERDSGFDQVPVIKGELASEAEAREVLSLPIYQSSNGLPSAITKPKFTVLMQMGQPLHGRGGMGR